MTNIPVLQLPSSEQSSADGLFYTFEQDGYIPTFWVIGPDMQILADDNAYPSDPGRYMR